MPRNLGDSAFLRTCQAQGNSFLGTNFALIQAGRQFLHPRQAADTRGWEQQFLGGTHARHY